MPPSRRLISGLPASLPAFLAVGVVGLLLDTALFTAAAEAGAPVPLARLLSLSAATVLTWTLNRHYVFGASGRTRREELARYAVVAGTAQGFSYGLFLLLVALAPAAPPQMALVAAACIAALASFLGQRAFAFRPAGAAA